MSTAPISRRATNEQMDVLEQLLGDDVARSESVALAYMRGHLSWTRAQQIIDEFGGRS